MPTTLKPVRLGAVAAAVIGVALRAWLVLGGDDDEGSQANEPQAVSVEDLQEEAGFSHVPVYWAGPQAGYQVEVYDLAGPGAGARDERGDPARPLNRRLKPGLLDWVEALG